MRDIRRDVTNLSNQQREVSPHGSLNDTTPKNNGPFNCCRITEFHQPPHFDEELHPPSYSSRRGGFGGRGMLDTLKKFQDHKLGMESHYMMIMNIQVTTTKPPTSNFKPWLNKEEAPRSTFQPPTKPKMEERGKIISNPPKYCKYNGVGHHASSCPTKRALTFREDLKWLD
ncbi:hypothetical protein M9H77_31143 [Catharanthus roseus]|uniref:Uncharacterized protein n=1 Tax=Catharanthus roseus TaxID=4058 RepID=A0ACC0A362_CATRO|nr:hypothetical protein M9H77_31143 [Catharanthus roseus]